MKRRFTQLFSVMVFLLSGINSYGQGWAATFGTPQHDFVHDVIEMPNGDFVFTGKGDSAAIVYRINAAGDSLWSNFINLEDESEGFAIIQTEDGGLALAGFSYEATVNNARVLLVKLETNGNVSWSQLLTFQPPTPQADDLAYDLLQTPDGGYLVAGTTGDHVGLLKTDEQGVLEWNNFYGSPSQAHHVNKLFALDNGNYAVVGHTGLDGGNDPRTIFLLRVDPAGNELGLNHHTFAEAVVTDAVATDDGGFFLVGEHAMYKLASDGSLEWSNLDASLGQNGEVMVAAKNQNGNILLAGPQIASVPIYFSLVNQNGGILWSNQVEEPTTTLKWVQNLLITSDGGYLVSGEAMISGEFGTLRRQCWLMKVENLTELYSNYLQGTIYFDENQNCQYDAGEQTLSGQIIEAQGQEDFYGVSAFDGQFSMLLNTGNYAVQIAPSAGPYWAICPDPWLVAFPTPDDTVHQNFGFEAIVDCPYLEVDISTPFLRRCFESTYNVHYCNQGTVDAQGAYVEVTLDPFLDYVTSTVPVASQQGDVYTFNVGNVAVNECGSFQIEVYVSCDAALGQTHCTEAHIFPDSLCLPTIWDGPVINVLGTCEGDSIQFQIINHGEAMDTPQEYIVTEDNIILMQESFQLGSGAEQRFKVFANGSTYRLEAAQAADYPEELGSNFSSVSIEGCNGFSPGFVTLFPEGDGAGFLSIDCQENRGAYDPNDKRAYPAGYGEEHFIARNTDLEYHIRFQNTGTDTAFTVVIRDTLDPHLDVTSVRPGAASHDYEFDISGTGLLKFTFEDILLPDSNINEPASHGFVKFRVAQKADLPIGTVIKNNAGIYFDFNQPVITNETWHTIGENFVEVVDVDDVQQAGVKTVVAPNPFSEETFIRVEGLELTGGTLRLFNAQGKQVQTAPLQSNQVKLDARHLPTGIYIFRLESGGQLISSGKVVVQ